MATLEPLARLALSCCICCALLAAGAGAATLPRDVDALHSLKERMLQYDQDGRWKAALDTWGAPPHEDDPCGDDWEGNWEGVQCRGQRNPRAFKVVTNIHLPDRGLPGPLPPELYLLRDLQEIDLDHNAHTGTIPPELGVCTPKMKELDFIANRLYGTIPLELDGLADLKDLELDENGELCGDVPPGIKSRLKRVDTEANNLLARMGIVASAGDVESGISYGKTRIGQECSSQQPWRERVTADSCPTLEDIRPGWVSPRLRRAQGGGAWVPRQDRNNDVDIGADASPSSTRSTTSGRRCVFPVNVGGVDYYDCIDSGGTGWCYSEDGRWEGCA